MARPGAEILLSQEVDTHLTMQIMDSNGVWVLTYNGKPCAVRELYYLPSGERAKYPRTGFNNLAHCQRLAEKFNGMFNTDKFACLEVVKYVGEKTMVRRLTTE
jgi:hypothetical protein